MTSAQMPLLNQAKVACGWQVLILLALICIPTLERDTSHFGKHIWFGAIGVPTLQELLLLIALLGLNFLNGRCDWQGRHWVFDLQTCHLHRVLWCGLV